MIGLLDSNDLQEMKRYTGYVSLVNSNGVELGRLAMLDDAFTYNFTFSGVYKLTYFCNEEHNVLNGETAYLYRTRWEVVFYFAVV